MSQGFSQTLAQRLFAVRAPLLVVFTLLTLLLGWQAIGIKVNTDVRKMVPLAHPYIQNFLAHREDVSLGNDIRVIVAEVEQDDIFNDTYLQALSEITDDIFSLQGVDPSRISSLWTPNVRWAEVTEDGFEGGEIVPPDYDGSPQSLEDLRTNVLRSRYVGSLVADDFRSTIIHAHLMDVLAADSDVDIPTLSRALDEIRERYQAQYPSVRVHIVGAAKMAGDVMSAAADVARLFFVTLLVTAILLLIDTRSLRASLVVVLCSFVAVFWQLGLVRLLGFTIDPYSMLVPFLVFAIAVSHGVQMINQMIHRSSDGLAPLAAARGTFAALAVPGIVALVSDGLGLLTLYVIDIGVIRELAIATSVGVGVIILTNLVIVPLVLSYVGVGQRAVQRAQKRRNSAHGLASFFARFTRTPWALASILVAGLLYAGGLYVARDAQIGDLEKGAPELWADPCDSQDCPRGYVPERRYQYNHDVNQLVNHYSVSADVLVVIGVTPPEQCNSYRAMQRVDDLAAHLLQLPGVQDVTTIASTAKLISANTNEGNLKWATIARDQLALNNAMMFMPDALYNMDCSVTPLYVFLDDHRAGTLQSVTAAVAGYAAQHNDPQVIEFKLASGNAGVEAATNETIAASQYPMLLLVYGVVILFCLIGFRDWRAVVCVIVPLGLTSVLCQALMVWLNIGVKVATLPVVALGVGIGVDYGIYIYSRLAGFLREGQPLEEAYRNTLQTTGKAVAFTGIALAVGVVFWSFSSIKFQADMGILLTFMFLLNMIGALWLLPALARFLLKRQPG
ncbi:efflux RND transporter permease subunit [Isoalcanivorax beigongshangi]|uniref:RND family transporter n=1 Tax=Isoalcanivorax beigongshangi TaxID=3238810 RepID=A0ABV4AG05_9GAMM